MTEPVESATAAGIATITLVDEDNKNALGPALINALRAELASANSDPEVRVIVLTNTGSTFCAGANLKQRSADPSQASASSMAFPELLVELQSSATPVVGKINGHVVGGGVGLACALDISIAAEDVRIGFTEVRLGVAPAIVSVICLPKMKRGDAMEAFLRGNRFSGTRAAEVGLITRAVPADQLDAETDAVVADVVRGGPNALAVAKQLVNQVPTMDQASAFDFTAELSAELFGSPEAAAGMKAFLERTPPPWTPDQ